MKKKPSKPQILLHLVVGTPDEEHCEICRAHSMGNAEVVATGPLGPVLVQELTPGRILRCPCPLCVRGREEGILE